MSDENLELLRRVVDAINADEILAELIAPDFEMKNATTAVTDATYHGHEGARKWRRELFDVFDDARFEVDEVLADGPDYVVIANRIVGRGSSSGAPLDMRWVSVLWFRDGQLRRADGYTNRREAIRAVGLGE
jgi:ketosteroid isomerase-like protein